VPLSKDLIQLNEHKIKRKPILHEELPNNSVMCRTEDRKCIFLNEDFTCNIYENRPEVCQSFGNETHPMLNCSWQSKEGRERSRQEKRMIERKNAKWVNRFNAFAQRLGMNEE